jgi:hypothetical protein
VGVFREGVAAVRSALKLSDELRRTSQELKDVAVELRDHDRRITRLEAQWETAGLLSRRRLERERQAGAAGVELLKIEGGIGRSAIRLDS